MDNRPIGVMDSGVGGLTVVKELRRKLPDETIIFLGDQARIPYGTKPVKQIQQFCLQIAHFLLKFDIKMMVIACNTATAAALDFLQEKLDIPVVGVILPGSKAANYLSRNQQIGLIGTENTIKSEAYTKTLVGLDQKTQVTGLATQEFVEIVEKDLAGTDEALQIIQSKLAFFQNHHIDTLILGCTHFPLLREQIQQTVGSQIQLVDPGKATVVAVEQQLTDSDGLADGRQERDQFFSTAEPSEFQLIARKWLEDPQLIAQQVQLGE